uniref:Uncharacterized protein n=1 Tax=Oryza punctata TaxID=4537 RepID=A0A0E0MFR6_ORYPU
MEPPQIGDHAPDLGTVKSKVDGESEMTITDMKLWTFFSRVLKELGYKEIELGKTKSDLEHYILMGLRSDIRIRIQEREAEEDIRIKVYFVLPLFQFVGCTVHVCFIVCSSGFFYIYLVMTCCMELKLLVFNLNGMLL